MKARRTHESDGVLTLPGGNEDNDLWHYLTEDPDGHIVICSTWEPTEDERARIAAGENIELLVWGTQHPPVAMSVTSVALGRAPRAS